ncbi:DUF3829 domain-containing protein [Aureibaculum sp. 2210JD6-5]|uniref:DUF6845 domain-containing protein n=1 Tax=Aureibaculum sp. 2210JD6-5 TaxID=3103957 RepID=UPI002AAE9C2A|nr:DUF3829 domain-containing protein [Aureibaculum sp. 2210JD6-5]MDY7394629.1 DUF3829 domain-containing protein [Aureibaculum sp. 2210JD6-5]
MKFKILFVLIAIVAVSCGKLGDKAKDALDAVSDLGSDDAGNVIAYNNALVDYMNEASNKITRAGEDYEKMSTMVAKKQKPRMFIANAFIGSGVNIDRDRDGIRLLEPGNSLPSDIKEELTNEVKATSEAYENTQEAYKSFKAYYDNEDFKDDDWAKGKELVDVIEKNIMAFYEGRSNSYKILKPVASAAEVKLLEDHPLKESLIASKTDLGLAEEIVNIVYAEQIDMDALTAKYNELEANYTKHKDLTPDLLKEHNKNLYYDNFYEDVEEFLGEVRKSKRDEKITEREAEYIGREYQSLIGYYNSFV